MAPYLAFLSVKYEVDPEEFFSHWSKLEKKRNPALDPFQLSAAAR